MDEIRQPLVNENHHHHEDDRDKTRRMIWGAVGLFCIVGVFAFATTREDNVPGMRLGAYVHTDSALKHDTVPRKPWDGSGCHTFECMKKVYDEGKRPSVIMQCDDGLHVFKDMHDGRRTVASIKGVFPEGTSNSDLKALMISGWKGGSPVKEGDRYVCESCTGKTSSGKSIDMRLVGYSYRDGSINLITAYPNTSRSKCRSVPSVTLKNGWTFRAEPFDDI